MLSIQQTTNFKKTIKKLHYNQKKDLDMAIKTIAQNPIVGDLKTGDLADIRVYKFKMAKQLTLLAYIYTQNKPKITLIALGSHENFYRDLKKSR